MTRAGGKQGNSTGKSARVARTSKRSVRLQSAAWYEKAQRSMAITRNSGKAGADNAPAADLPSTTGKRK